jgi:hypothetical protein
MEMQSPNANKYKIRLHYLPNKEDRHTFFPLYFLFDITYTAHIRLNFPTVIGSNSVPQLT